MSKKRERPTVIISARVDPELQVQVSAAAEKFGMTVSEFTNLMLTNSTAVLLSSDDPSRVVERFTLLGKYIVARMDAAQAEEELKRLDNEGN